MQAVILIGIQASGKSTFYKEKFIDTHVRLNLDLLRTRNREKLFLEVCLLTKQKFVVDNTNPTIEERKRYIIPAKEAGFRVTGYYFASNISSIVERNKFREGTKRIPEAGLFGTLKRLQKPNYDEGFDEIFHVNPLEGNFIINAWRDSS
jgi:predicted kinase